MRDFSELPYTLRHKTASGTLWRVSEDRMMFSNLYSIQRGKGHATELMEKICEIADNENCLIRLEAKQYGDVHGLTTDELVEFYSKFDFVLTPHHSLDSLKFMERPRKNYTGYNDTSLTPERTTS